MLYCWRRNSAVESRTATMTTFTKTPRSRGLRRGGQPDNGLDGAYLLVTMTRGPHNEPVVAVSPDITYVQAQAGDRRFVLAEASAAAYARELGEELRCWHLSRRRTVGRLATAAV